MRSLSLTRCWARKYLVAGRGGDGPLGGQLGGVLHHLGAWPAQVIRRLTVVVAQKTTKSVESHELGSCS